MAGNRRRFYIEDADLLFCNFAGREKRYEGRIMNEEGKRNFCVVISDELAGELAEEGWNVKREKLNDGEIGRPYIKVNVSYRFNPPSINMDNGRKVTELTEETVNLLDDMDIISADVAITPSRRTDGGYSAYVYELYANVEESRFARKHTYDYEDDAADEACDVPF